MLSPQSLLVIKFTAVFTEQNRCQQVFNSYPLRLKGFMVKTDLRRFGDEGLLAVGHTIRNRLRNLGLERHTILNIQRQTYTPRRHLELMPIPSR